MIVYLSPAKTMHPNFERLQENITTPVFLKQAGVLMKALKPLPQSEVTKLMKISQNLGYINYERIQQWNQHTSENNLTPAIIAYKGEVYNGLSANTLTDTEIKWSQQHLRILSGLYGYLKPLDGVQPYRLELGIKWSTPDWKNLYEFWGTKLSTTAKKELKSNGVLVNLASNEYYKALDLKNASFRVITPEFKDYKSGIYKIITIYAKHQRGAMTRFIIQNQLNDPEDLKAYSQDGYVFNPNLSVGDRLVFTRG